MSDSDMEIDDDEVEQKAQKHTIEGGSEMLDKPIQDSNFHNNVKNHSVTTTPSVELSKIIKEQALSQNNVTLSRFPAIPQKSFFPGGERIEPAQKRVARPCKYFAKGWCFNGMSCKFLHVKENSNLTSQQQAGKNMAGTSSIQSYIEVRTPDSKEGIRVSQFSGNGMTSLHTREDISFVNPIGSQRVFSSLPFLNPPVSQRVFPLDEMRFMPSSETIGRESLTQTCSTGVTDNRSLVINNSNGFTLRSSFVHDHRSSISSYLKPDTGSSRPAWTGSLSSSVPTNEHASTLGHSEDGNNMYGSASLPTLQEIAVSSDKGAEGNNSASDKKKNSSDDWERSEPFKASFTIPSYILPSADALYGPFTDIENLGDRSLNASLSSKGEQKDGDSTSGPQERDCRNDDKSSSCSQNQHEETVAGRNLKAHGVATSVVDQNDTTTSKEISSTAVAENGIGIKKSKPWHRSDGSSYKKPLRSDEVDGEVMSEAGKKVMRQFRNAVVETIKEMLKPVWHEGRLTKDIHNMIVKKAAEKVVSAAVQFQQVPTATESVEQYLGQSATKIVKLVEGYVQRYGKPRVTKLVA